MRVKIISGGLYHNSKVINADTGEEIKYVVSVKIDINPDNQDVKAIIELLNPEIEAIVDVDL